MQPLNNPFETLQIKWEVNILLKKPSCVFVLLASLSLFRCELFYIYMCMYVDVNLHMWLYSSKTRISVERLIWVIPCFAKISPRKNIVNMKITTISLLMASRYRRSGHVWKHSMKLVANLNESVLRAFKITEHLSKTKENTNKKSKKKG